MKMNKKGFTLVELLAVIVILAVVMLIATTAVGPMMTKSRISSLGTEGIQLVDAAKTAYQAEQLKGDSKIKATSTVCFDMEWLKNEGYFTKGSADGYSGSVLVTYNAGNYTYTYWLSNGTYWLKSAKADGGYSEVDNNTVYDAAPSGVEMSECAGQGSVKCLSTSACV